MALPSKIDEAVARRVFADMRRLGWSGLSNGERSAQYEEWMNDPEVGGRLGAFMPLARARVWVKDGPVKEYPRAEAGQGKYATFLDASEGPAARIVRAALGAGWECDPASQKVKPLRVVTRSVSDGELERVVAWGPARDLKHLVWALLLARAAGDSRPWILAITYGFTDAIDAADRLRHKRIVEQVGAVVAHVEMP